MPAHLRRPTAAPPVMWLAAAAGALAAACGGSSAGARTFTDADFAGCAGSPALVYAPGLTVPSTSGAFQAVIESAATDAQGGPQVATVAIGLDTLVLSISGAAGTTTPDGPAPADADTVLMAATSKPWMPVRMHGASTIPTVDQRADGTFAVAGVDFFTGGYWQVPLDLVAPNGAADTVVLPLCVPDD